MPLETFPLDNSDPAIVMADSHNVLDRDGYERIIILTGWDWNPNLMAQIHYRIDRYIEHSFFNVYVWDSVEGWVKQPSGWETIEMWGEMPGYLRGASDRADRAGRAVIRQMVAKLQGMTV